MNQFLLLFFRTGTSLQGLARQLLGIELDKSIHIRCGDWESPQLSQDQVSISFLGYQSHWFISRTLLFET